MNFVGLFKRGDDLDRLDTDMEDGMADVLLSQLATPSLQPNIGVDADDYDTMRAGGSMDYPSGDRRMTPYAQNKMSALAAFEEMFQGTRQDLQLLGTTFAKVTSAHHMTREFLTTIHADIHHANELELSNAQLQTENRKLARQLEETAKILQQRDSALEALEHREGKLTLEAEVLRVSLGEARAEASDAGHAVAMLESERGELMNSLASKSVTAEKLLRENEVMREKHINLSVDLDNTLKKQTEAQRRFDELSAVHSRETAQSGERLSKLVASEKEVLRVQKQHDALQARLQEFHDTIRGLEVELDDTRKRRAAETETLKKELHSLNSRLQTSAKEQVEKATEIAGLRMKLNDAVSEKRIAAEKFDALRAEHERDKKQLSAASANFSELNLLQTSEHVMLDLQKHEADELRREVAALRDSVKRLAPFERLYNATRARHDAHKAGDEVENQAAATDRDLEGRTERDAEGDDAAEGDQPRHYNGAASDVERQQAE